MPALKTTGVIAAACLASAATLAATGHPPIASTPQASGTSATAELSNPDGRRVGRVELRESEAGVLLRVRLDGVPAGTHAIHLHEHGRCESPSFESAGGHVNPTGAHHGLLHAEGPHAGDLPNLHVPESGTLDVELVAANAALDNGTSSLMDADGSAVVIHEGADDYRTDPAGDAGSRIACGVVTR
jgi:superoxide dismutase, Cu-Zn family